MAPARVLLRPYSLPKDGRDIGTSGARRVISVFDMTRVSILEWYRILRIHREWTIFQAVRFALWLAR